MRVGGEGRVISTCPFVRPSLCSAARTCCSGIPLFSMTHLSGILLFSMTHFSGILLFSMTHLSGILLLSWNLGLYTTFAFPCFDHDAFTCLYHSVHAQDVPGGSVLQVDMKRK